MRFNTTQLRNRARDFALIQAPARARHGSPRFWSAFRADVKSLTAFSDRLSAIRVECSQPAEGWLRDHIAFIRTQAQEVQRMMGGRTLRQLPVLEAERVPRIYALADDYLEHSDGHYDPDSFKQYVQAYQEVSVLGTVECWTLPSALRVAIIRRLANTMAEVRHRHEVCESVSTLLDQLRRHGHSAAQVRSILSRMANHGRLSPVEVVHLVRHLTEYEPHIHVVRQWLAHYVEHTTANLEQMTSLEHHLQADLQVIAGDLITSLHRIERQPWQKTFTEISRVEQLFMADRRCEYAAMDFASRDLLRQSVVRIADRLGISDTLVAEYAVKLAREVTEADPETTGRSSYVPYYLLDPEGLARLMEALAETTGAGRMIPLIFQRRPFATYLIPQLVIYGLGMALVAYLATRHLAVGSWAVLAIVVLLAVPISQWAITFVQSAVLRHTSPGRLLRYDFSDHIPESAETMVVIPVIWSTPAEVDEVVNRLLVHYLSNRQAHLHFAILGDFADGPKAESQEDRMLLQHAISRIDHLRNQYGSDRFFLFHRARRYNPVDDIYMGWERKRGKLVEFVSLLKGDQTTSYTTVHGDTKVFPNVRYICTVDQDTKLPIGAVSRLVGTIHLPYNRPRVNATGTRVIEGFGIIQPRVTVSYEAVQRSRFAALWAGEPGIDPYAFAVADPYQDLFGQASYAGKGIFDVNAFHTVLADRIPDHLVLSHDLLEGGFLRTGLAQDIEFVEDHPSSFYSHQVRADRWIRGDWQLIKWLGLHLKNRQGVRQAIDLGGLTRFQMIDNMRRSLLSPALFALSLAGSSVLPGRESIYEGLVLLTIFLPFIQSLSQSLTPAVRHRQRIATTFLQGLVQLITLPFTAVGNLIAIGRSLYRLWISRRHLLEWTPGAQADRHRSNRTFVHEWVGYGAIGAFILLTWTLRVHEAWAWGTILPALWISAPWVIRALDRPAHPPTLVPSSGQREALNTWAAEIWAFFERYVTAEESWLPPDNVQYYPEEVIAHRTSPTNIGLYLSTVLAAYELGFLTMRAAIQRLEATVTTIASLEKWHGHLYNWYDTQTGDPLSPRYVSTVDSGNLLTYFILMRQTLADWLMQEHALAPRIQALLKQIQRLIEATDFQVLYDSDARLFSLGVNSETNRREPALYDLLASEARQASFVAIALGQIPVSHWFTLGRTMTIAGGHKTLVSWSGTMFEYLLPALVLRTYPNTVWDMTYQGVIAQQKAYTSYHHVPFGISESGYFAFDYRLNYQYHAFGVPGLGLAPGLENDLVVAPYATMLALPYALDPAVAALGQFETIGAKGPYGFYEAVDCTGPRMPDDTSYQVVHSFMAHHQAMSLLAIVNALTNFSLVRRFHQDPEVQSAELLLQERVPDHPYLLSMPAAVSGPPDLAPVQKQRKLTAPSAIPEVDVLSNTRFTTVMFDNGASRLSWNQVAVNRWHDDPTAANAGLAIYLRDIIEGCIMSATPFPVGDPSQVEVAFQIDQAIFHGHGHDLAWILETTVHPDWDAEVRRLTLTNTSPRPRQLEITTFLDIALAPAEADRAHPAYSKLFIETAYESGQGCLLAERRPSRPNELPRWMFQTLSVQGGMSRPDEFDTDRASFVGRSHGLSDPDGLGRPLAGHEGAVINPAFVMRTRLHLDPGSSQVLYVVTGVGLSKSDVLTLADRLRDPAQADRAFHLAWIHRQIDLRHLHLTFDDAHLAQRLAGRLLVSWTLSDSRRTAIQDNALPAPSLWRFGVGGTLPVLVVHLRHPAEMTFLVYVARLHHYLETRLNLLSDLVILDDNDQQLNALDLLRAHLEAQGLWSMEHIVRVAGRDMNGEERALLRAAARLWLQASGPSLNAQVGVTVPIAAQILPFYAGEVESTMEDGPATEATDTTTTTNSSASVEFDNGFGGFAEHGHAYVIRSTSAPPGPVEVPPRPWSNILANPEFGALMTDRGLGYTWWHNGREFKLTPWSNDPVTDRPGQVLYVRDLDEGPIWSATPDPAGVGHSFRTSHGWGFTRFEGQHGALRHTLEVTVPVQDPVELLHFTIENTTAQPKRLALTYYAAWVLGTHPDEENPYIVTHWDPVRQMLWAKNQRQQAFRDAIAFIRLVSDDTTAISPISYTGDRGEFLGRTGSEMAPHALQDTHLSNRSGAFATACGALQIAVEVPAHGRSEILVVVGAAPSLAEAEDLARRYPTINEFSTALAAVQAFWSQNTQAIQIETPDRAMDILMNGWLVYQTLACRLFARTAFYQAGGAYGFRDQLQDSLALLPIDKTYARSQILRSAAHQYQSGDVQHWWHDELHRGIRTRIADDLLWLPYAVSRYIEVTGDDGILDEDVPYLKSPELSDGEDDRFEEIQLSDEHQSVLDHCLRAIRHASRFGEHHLPLMEGGDWNDGMNRVGSEGRGESVWLGWFLLEVLGRFHRLPHPAISQSMRDDWRQRIQQLLDALNQSAWDGAWFRRAYTDHGEWIGSKDAPECQIDAIAQSWSVIAQGTSLERQRAAMAAFDRYLVDRRLELARLLTPPFDITTPSPGYIQGYPPGIRENGGQYTHGAIWSVVAWAMLGEGDKAFELFSLLNPINHTQTASAVRRYGNEPYVMSADVYTAPPYPGRGGWSWYTGAAGWMYQAGLEYVLGVRVRGAKLYIRPAVPASWSRFRVQYRYRRSTYAITVEIVSEQPEEACWIVDQGPEVRARYLDLALFDDGETHQVRARIRRDASVQCAVEDPTRVLEPAP